ncbi:unnamed protein product, partial [Trichobilharzia regenti]
VIHLRKELRHPSTTCLSFVTTLKVARQCLNFAQETVVLAESFSNTNELKGCSLPVRRELIEVKFMLVTILHSIMSLHVMYMKAKLQESTLKDPLFCAVENYIGENSLDSLPETLNNYEQPKQIWDRTILTAFDEIYSLLSDIFIMSEKQPHLLAQIPAIKFKHKLADQTRQQNCQRISRQLQYTHRVASSPNLFAILSYYTYSECFKALRVLYTQHTNKSSFARNLFLYSLIKTCEAEPTDLDSTEELSFSVSDIAVSK